MFNDKYGLTQAVLDGRKTMTRRMVCTKDVRLPVYMSYDIKTRQLLLYDACLSFVEHSRYAFDEVVTIAQSYRSILQNTSLRDFVCQIECDGELSDEFENITDGKGFKNKMFVKAKYMPHHIKISGIRVERLQDISNEDCLREGVYIDKEGGQSIGYPLAVPFYCTFRGAINRDGKQLYWSTPKEAFAKLIDKVSGKGTWDSNPLVWVYEFELVRNKKH